MGTSKSRKPTARVSKLAKALVTKVVSMTSAHPGLDTTYKKEAVMKMQQEAARNYHTAGVLLGLATMTISFDPRSDQVFFSSGVDSAAQVVEGMLKTSDFFARAKAAAGITKPWLTTGFNLLFCLKRSLRTFITTYGHGDGKMTLFEVDRASQRKVELQLRKFHALGFKLDTFTLTILQAPDCKIKDPLEAPPAQVDHWPICWDPANPPQVVKTHILGRPDGRVENYRDPETILKQKSAAAATNKKKGEKRLAAAAAAADAIAAAEVSAIAAAAKEAATAAAAAAPARPTFAMRLHMLGTALLGTE